jgi:hypothetical protein
MLQEEVYRKHSDRLLTVSGYRHFSLYRWILASLVAFEEQAVLLLLVHC